MPPGARPPRRYDRAVQPRRGRYAPEPRAPSEGRDTLVPVEWDGLSLNTGDQGDGGLCSVIENVEGWVDSPPLNGNDAARVHRRMAQRGGRRRSGRGTSPSTASPPAPAICSAGSATSWWPGRLTASPRRWPSPMAWPGPDAVR